VEIVSAIGRLSEAIQKAVSAHYWGARSSITHMQYIYIYIYIF